jgi:hypothetical protein
MVEAKFTTKSVKTKLRTLSFHYRLSHFLSRARSIVYALSPEKIIVF